MSLVLGIDAGNYETKVCSSNGVTSFLSDIGEYRERTLVESFSKDDIVWEYNGQKGFAGTLAKFESEFGGTIKGMSKAHSEGILRVLMAICKSTNDTNINCKIVVGQPIKMHTPQEKQKIKNLLNGKHEIVINGSKRNINIERVEVAPEGSTAILSNPKNGLVRIIDIGSGTTNFATLYNLKRIDKDSFTKQIGTEVMRNKDPEAMANGIFKLVSATWDLYDEVLLVGGGAAAIHPHLSKSLMNCKVLKPMLSNNIVSEKYANCIGFYLLARMMK